MLPPVIALDKPASACGDPAIENGVEAELTTFLNQVEGHSGQAAILRLLAQMTFQGQGNFAHTAVVEFDAGHGIGARGIPVSALEVKPRSARDLTEATVVVGEGIANGQGAAFGAG